MPFQRALEPEKSGWILLLPTHRTRYTNVSSCPLSLSPSLFCLQVILVFNFDFFSSSSVSLSCSYVHPIFRAFFLFALCVSVFALFHFIFVPYYLLTNSSSKYISIVVFFLRARRRVERMVAMLTLHFLSTKFTNDFLHLLFILRVYSSVFLFLVFLLFVSFGWIVCLPLFFVFFIPENNLLILIYTFKWTINLVFYV